MVTGEAVADGQPIVVDASAVLGWLVEDPSPSADSPAGVLERIVAPDEAGRIRRFHAPALLSFEVTNALVMGERRGRWASEDVAEVLDLLARWPIETEPAPDGPTRARIVAICRIDGLTAYDAAYLELAGRAEATLLTFDRRLAQAATRRGIGVVGAGT